MRPLHQFAHPPRVLCLSSDGRYPDHLEPDPEPFTDNNTPVTGFFTWDATTETVTAFDISTQAGTGALMVQQ